MIRLCKYNQDSVIEKVKKGKLDAVTLSTSNLIDDIILEMNKLKVLDCLKDNIPDLRAKNTTIPYNLIWASAITAKMKVQTSLTDIPYAIGDHKTLAELGYTVIDTDNNLKNGLMQESSLRFLLGKYNPDLFIYGYNNTVQKSIFPLLNISPDIHILDCTDIEVNYDNSNYENAGIWRDKHDNSLTRGYKLATLRGIVEDTGLIEEIRFGSINTHDINLSKEMVMNSPVLKPGDILINDRGFISRDLMNYLKIHKSVDTYIPLKSDMDAFDQAICIAKEQNNWKTHPNPKHKEQMISFVPELGTFWRSKYPDEDVPFNACVVWYKDTNAYSVFITTDLTATGVDIIRTYELRPEIEEDYRQLKDFWKIEDFKSTKLNVILFHIVCVLFGYLFFQLYTLSPEGVKYLHKSLPVILKSYMPEVHPYVVLYSGYEFGVLTLFELMKLYAQSSDETKKIFEKILK